MYKIMHSSHHLDFDHLGTYYCLFYRVVMNDRLSERHFIEIRSPIFSKGIFQRCTERNSKICFGGKPSNPYFLSLSQ